MDAQLDFVLTKVHSSGAKREVEPQHVPYTVYNFSAVKVSPILSRPLCHPISAPLVHVAKIHHSQVKPLKILWDKHPHWTEKNTLHVDDLARNFALNPK